MKISKLLIFVFLFLFIFLSSKVVAAKDLIEKEIPEINGTYDDPSFKNIKVRVFVHNQRSAPNPTQTLMCQLPDIDSQSIVGSAGWKLPLNWQYNLNTTSVPSVIGATNLEKFTKIIFDNYTASSGITFLRGANISKNKQAYDGYNIISWGRTSGSALGVTYTRYNSQTGEVVDVDTIMNNKFIWSWTDQTTNNMCAQSNSYDAQNILTHEIGHWLGLDDEYDTSFISNTMYGYGSKAEVKKNTLTSGDIQGIDLIY